MKLLSKDIPASEQETTLKAVADVLDDTGKKAEAKKVEQEIAKLGPLLDAEFKLTAIPFTPKPFKGRKSNSKRVVAVELFTGAQCPPCVAADTAFDALLTTYKADEVALLQYHLHIPLPDQLTSPDSEKRAEYYMAKDEQSTPALFVNGQVPDVIADGKKQPMVVGGPKPFAKKRYEDLREILDKALDKNAPVDLELKVSREGDKIEVTAEVGKQKKASEKTKLRLVVIEDEVQYPAKNKQRFHHHVVRGFLGGVGGIAVKEMGGTFKETLDLKKLKLSLIDYLSAYDKMDPFPDELRPLELKNLKIVALVQDDATKEILNAAQVDVPKGK
jgi:hypothetical protein